MARLIKGRFYLDIFYYEQTGNGFLVDPYPYYYAQEDGYLHQYNDVFPLKKCMLGGVGMTCPRNTTKYLIKNFGEDFMTPEYKCFDSNGFPLDWGKS